MDDDGRVTSDVIAAGIIKAVCQLGGVALGGYLVITYPWLLAVAFALWVLYLTVRGKTFFRAIVSLLIGASFLCVALGAWLMFIDKKFHDATVNGLIFGGFVAVGALAQLAEWMDKRKARREREEFEALLKPKPEPVEDLALAQIAPDNRPV